MFKKFTSAIKELEYNNLYPLFFTLVFICILIQYSFHTLDAIFYDLWVRTDLTTKASEEVVVVTMDEESDQFLGELFPYTYATHNRFLEKVLKEKPSALGYLVPFLDPDSVKDRRFIKRFKGLLEEFKDEGGIFRIGTSKDLWGEQIPPDELKSLGYSLALINKDGNAFARDGVTRRVILNISGEDSFHLWMTKEVLKQKNREQTNSKAYKGSYYDRESDATFALFKYSSNPIGRKTFKHIPFHRVVVGNYPKDFFQNKIILVGSQYLSNPDDFSFTPYTKENIRSPKINIHGQIIDALVERNTVIEVNDWVTDIMAVFIAFLLSFIISKVQPAKGLIITIALMLSMFLLAYTSFSLFGVWFKISHIILSIFVVYYIWVPFRAIGEYQTRYAFQEETKALKKVDRLKQNFISLMSHDLKTPVAKIAGIADILKVQYPNTENQNTLLTNIIEATKELNNFISSILDLTKIESQELALKIENKDINPILENIEKAFKYEATEKEMEIELELGPLYPIQIDVTLINRVFSNIVGNSIKYAGQGKKIEIKTWDDEQWVYVEVSDNGKGIKAEDLENIFEKFYRVKNDENHQIKGSGLGLYLVKYFIELHKGEISVDSRFGEGTKFTIKLKNE